MRFREGARTAAAASALLAAAALVACSGGGLPEPEKTALRLFELAGQEEPAAEELAACFGPLPGESERAALLDALESLGPASAPRVIAKEELDDLGIVVIDLAATLPGEGTAQYSVHLEGDEEGAWVIRWFRGPGVEWPHLGRPGGPGLTSSPPPD